MGIIRHDAWLTKKHSDKYENRESYCREKERGASSSKRGAEPAKANLQKLQMEVSDLNQQLAEAVQAAEAAEGRYQQARAAVRWGQ